MSFSVNNAITLDDRHDISNMAACTVHSADKHCTAVMPSSQFGNAVPFTFRDVAMGLHTFSLALWLALMHCCEALGQA